MASPRIVLAGLGPNLHGLTWESDRILRIGRQPSSEVVVHDFSVERAHAEIKHHGVRWVLSDLANNPVYPTAVNHNPLCGKDHVLKNHDLIQIGKVLFKVIQLVHDAPDDSTPTLNVPARSSSVGEEIKSSRMNARVQSSLRQSWNRALDLRGNHALVALARTNEHLLQLTQPDGLLRSILADAVAGLKAQRGSILLADPITGDLALKATVSPGEPSRGSGRVAPADPLGGSARHHPYSRTLAERCFASGESILCQDVNADEALVLTRSIRHGAMASILCVLLRTPTKSIGILHLDRGFIDDPFTETDLRHADAFAASVSVGIETTRLFTDQRAQFVETVSILARAVEARDQYTGNHTRRVTDFALLLADELNLSARDKYHLQIGSPLHDIGKINIDDAILRKPGKLTFGEFEHMKTHTIKGATMLDAMIHLGPMIPIIRHHHERWDGAGYPDGLAREQIPLIARIVSVADAFDAMTSDRPYRLALPVEQAYLELIGKAGTHFDPACVYAFLRLRQKIEARLASRTP